MNIKLFLSFSEPEPEISPSMFTARAQLDGALNMNEMLSTLLPQTYYYNSDLEARERSRHLYIIASIWIALKVGPDKR